ncbi:MAG: lipopolysaccharide export system protein LptC [Phenylobacterium sp.]
MNKLRLLASFIFICVMTIMWASLDDKSVSTNQSGLDGTERPAYVAVNLNRLVYDESGNRVQKLTAQKMTYYKSTNRAEFDQPLLIVKSERKNAKINNNKANTISQWRISANSGILYNNERLHLTQDVNAVNLNTTEYINSIEAQTIQMNIKDNILLSDNAVQINGDDVTMVGSGLVANLNDQQIELIKHAETIYQSTKK